MYTHIWRKDGQWIPSNSANDVLWDAVGVQEISEEEARAVIEQLRK